MTTPPSTQAVAVDPAPTLPKRAWWLAPLSLDWWHHKPVLVSLVLAIVGLTLLEFYRPYYFFTDDNLNHYPVLAEEGRNLLAGRNPFYSQYLSGGNFLILHEASFLHFSHPVTLLIGALLVYTPWKYATQDVLCWCYMLCSVGFTTYLFTLLREKFTTGATDAQIVFLSLSTNFSIWTLVVTSSAGMYLVNQAILPVLIIGLLQENWKKGALWIGIGLANGFLAGNAGPVVMTIAFGSVFALLLARYEQKTRAIDAWVGGGILFVILVLPILIPAFSAFTDSSRSGAQTIEQARQYNIPLSTTALAYFFGSFTLFMGDHAWTLHELPAAYPVAFSSCFAAWWIFGSFRTPQSIPFVAWLSLGLALFALVLTARPVYLQSIMQYIPFIKSLRWPYKDLMFFHFFLHMWMVMNPPRWKSPWQLCMAILGIGIWLWPMLINPAPSMSPRYADRDALLSGRAERYWTAIKRLLPPDAIIVPAAVPTAWIAPPQYFYSMPQCAIASYNFGAMFEVKTLGCYSVVGTNGVSNDLDGYGVYVQPLPPYTTEVMDNLKTDKRLYVVRCIINPQGDRILQIINFATSSYLDLTNLWIASEKPEEQP
ncbi:MAG: hypothetical protein ACAI35_12730 [Candidatus Methylacidiphilales bacterium]|nr:hypothetical protein [Candidatus Methylacidiphilales bacterium]